MRWYEYKMELDDLHASDDLKAKLLAMQPAEEAPKPASPVSGTDSGRNCIGRTTFPAGL